jgi:hypothetical protein
MPANHLVNLANNYLYVAFYDEGKDTLMGKVIKVKGQNKGKSWKPANKTTGLLLYLLNREDNDSIDYNTFTNLVNQKFNNVPAGAIDAFLNFLKERGALDTGGNVTTATKTPDPLNLFSGTKLNWDKPDFLGANDATFGSTHGYSPGYVMITIWK